MKILLLLEEYDIYFASLHYIIQTFAKSNHHLSFRNKSLKKNLLNA
jgi:hypothetical protein